MANKIGVTKKKMAGLSIKKSENGNYVYIDPADENKSKYKEIKRRG